MNHAATCPNCGAYIPPGAQRCPTCGAAVTASAYAAPPQPLNPVYMQQPHPAHYQPVHYIERYGRSHKEKNRRVAGAIGAFAALSFFIYLLISLVYLIWSPSLVIPNGMFYGAELFIIIPTIVPIITLTGWAFAAYYIFLVVAISLSFFHVSFRDWKLYSRELNMTWKTGEHSTLFGVAGIFFAVLFFDLLYMIAISLFLQANPASPDFSSIPIWRNMYIFANASVWEEIITRILMLGIPLLAYHTIRGRTKYPVWKYFLGGGIEFDNAAIILVLFSSVMFGLGHLGSWDIYKVFPTAVAGVAFAYVFLKYGLTGSILLHFAFDFTSIPGMMSPTFDNLYIILMLFWFLIGAIFFFYYAEKLVKFIDVRFGAGTPSGKHHIPSAETGPAHMPYLPPAHQYYQPPPPVFHPGYQPYYDPYNPYNAPAYPPHREAYYPPHTAQHYPPPAYGAYPPQYPQQYQQTPPPPGAPQHPYAPPQTYQQHTERGHEPSPPPARPYGTGQERAPASHPHDSRSPPAGRGFICPMCGHTEARYENGELICLRCGARTRL